MTPGCTKQACSYRDGAGKLSKLDAVVVGVSGDNVQSLKYFKTAENLNFTLLSDHKGEVAEAFQSRLAPGAKSSELLKVKKLLYPVQIQPPAGHSLSTRRVRSFTRTRR